MTVSEVSIDSILERIKEFEKQISALKNDLEEIKDVQIVDKMDVVNLKNEVEGMEMANPELSDNKETKRDLQDLHEELQEIKTQLSGGGLNVCRKCGTIIQTGSKFCGKCGEKI